MIEAKHTPGPWGVSPDGWRVFANVTDPETFSYICATANNASTRTERNKANARLIAAAPDLLEALKETREALMCAMRWLAENDSEESILVDGWLEECQRLGIKKGVGVRSGAIVAKAEGRSE